MLKESEYTPRKLYDIWMERCDLFCDMNMIPRPIHVIQTLTGVGRFPTMQSTGLYLRPRRGESPETAKCIVNLERCAEPAWRPSPRRCSWPGWKTDRTPAGVVCHELGHHVAWWNYKQKGAYWREFAEVLKRLSKLKRISSYEPVPEEAFTETFRLFMTNPDLLRCGNPGRYDILVNELKLLPIETRRYDDVFADAPDAIQEYADEWVEFYE